LKGWYKINNSDTVFVFIHGVFSDAEKCWTSKCGKFWPELIANDARFNSPSIYLAEFYTSVDSADYGIQNCAQEIFQMLNRKDTQGNPPPIAKKKMVLIGHSTGGILIRYILEAYSDDFLKKDIGVCLYASPSFGSKLSTIFRRIAKTFNHKLAQELSWGSHILEDLDHRFRLLLDARKLSIVGMEAYENNAPFSIPFINMRVVEKQSAAKYFGSRTLIPGSDHSTIVKPVSVECHSHQALLDFVEKNNFIEDKSILGFDKPSLFDRYAPEYESYFVNRAEDDDLLNFLQNYSVWVCGETGVGKTATISRALHRSGINHNFISLGACINSSVNELISEIHLDISGEEGCEKSQTSQFYVKKIAKALNEKTKKDTYYLLIEEIPINSEGMFSEFSNYIYAIISAIEKHNNFRVILSSIFKPNTIPSPELSKISERIKIVEWSRWAESDIERLVSVIRKDTDLDVEDKPIAAFEGNPRKVKQYFRDKLSRAN
jgi:hypothetical protein